MTVVGWVWIGIGLGVMGLMVWRFWRNDDEMNERGEENFMTVIGAQYKFREIEDHLKSLDTRLRRLECSHRNVERIPVKGLGYELWHYKCADCGKYLTKEDYTAYLQRELEEVNKREEQE